MIEIFYNSIIYNTTNNTNNFYGLIPNIDIFSEFTLNINNFYKNTINRVDIIDNLINYVIGDINKYMLNLLIADSGQTYIEVNKIGTYCIELYYNSESFYLIMNVSNQDYIPPISTPEITTTVDTSYEIQGGNTTNPIIYYNSPPLSGASWLGSGTTVPYNVKLDLIHNGVTGWTLESLKYLFIDKVIGCFDGQMSLNNIGFELSQGFFYLTGITNSGVYNIEIIVEDSAGNTTINNISNIVVDNDPPVIVYNPYIFMNITGSTNIYSGASSGITPNIYIPSGFTFNLNEFDQNLINRMDIIDNIVSYAYDNVDLDVNKYKIDVLIAGKHNANYIIYTGITNPGYYCIKFTLSDKYNNSINQYFMSFVTYDVSVYSEGYWQDNKVWIDFTLWLDHPKIPR